MGDDHDEAERAPLRRAPARALLASLAVAVLALAPLWLSACRFLRLPPPGVPFAELGIGLTRVDPATAIVVEPDGDHAWISSLAYTGPGVRVLAACRVVIATARATRCEELLDIAAGETVTELHHAVASGRGLLVVARVQDAEAGGAWRAALAGRTGSVVRWSVALPWGAEGKLTNVGWSPATDRFELFAGGCFAEGACAIARQRVDLEGGLGAWERWEAPGVDGRLGGVVAVIAGEPPRAVVEDGGRLVRLEAGRAVALDAPCAYPFTSGCVEPSSRAHHVRPWGLALAWLDATGRVVPYALPAPDAVGPSSALLVVERLREDGSADPWIAVRMRGEEEGGEWERTVLSEPPALARDLVLATVEGGSEQVLLARSGERQVRVARGGYALGTWEPIPGDEALLLLDASGSRAVVLDRAGEPRLRASRGAGWLEMLGDRLAVDPLATLVYLSAVLLSPVLLLAGAVALRRARRVGAPPHPALIGALYAVAVAALVLLWLHHRNIFPP